MGNKMLYDAISEFSKKFGTHKFNDDKNHDEYMKLVDMCIECGKIYECNREQFSTHGRLDAAIVYESNRRRFCNI